MAQYQYLAVDKNGSRTRGYLSARSDQELLSLLRGKGLYCVQYKAASPIRFTRGYRVSLRDLSVFSRQLAVMLQAGIPVVQAIEMLYRKTESKKFRTSLLLLSESVQKGSALSGAMEEQGDVYPPFLINMIASGEASGHLDEVMNRMSTHYDREHQMRGRLQNALIYPCFLLATSLVVVAILLAVVLPQFTAMFDMQTLPASTRMLLSVSGFLSRYGLFALLGGLLLVGFLSFAAKTEGIKYRLDKIKITFPYVGKWMKTLYTAQAARVLAALYASGVPLTQALQNTSAVLGNSYIAKKLEGMIWRVEQGGTLSEAVEEAGVFESMFQSMVYIGEESGRLDEVLSGTAGYFDEQASTALKSLMALVEPVLIVLLALFVGFIIISIITPIYTQMGQVV